MPQQRHPVPVQNLRDRRLRQAQVVANPVRSPHRVKRSAMMRRSVRIAAWDGERCGSDE